MLRRGGIVIVALFILPACTLNFAIDSLPDGDGGVSATDADTDGSRAEVYLDSRTSDSADDTFDGSTADGTVDATDTVDVPVATDGDCLSPYVLCGGSCVNEAIDPTHCGGCASLCSGAANATPACSSSRCTFICGAGFADCDTMASNGCEANTATDDANCGRCGVACHGAHHCAGGACH